MKKAIIILILITLLSFKTNDTGKLLKVEGSKEVWQAIINVIDKSNAPHLDVEAAKQFIIEQVNKQLDTTKNKK